MGRRKKAKGKGNICPHCNIEMDFENGENGYDTEYWFECSKCGRQYDDNTGEDITDYEYLEVSNN
jgi:DNA-directed RNA polymerase subunit RPC12/RpoP